MSVPLYFDHHVPTDIAEALRLREVDVLTAAEHSATRTPDEQLLERSTSLGRVMVSQDRGFLAITNRWLRAGRAFAGLAYFRQMNVSMGRVINDLEIVAKGQDPDSALNQVRRLPF